MPSETSRESSTMYLWANHSQTSSNEGDVVLNPFCGCGTTIAAAQKLNRQWIGIDVTHLAIGLMKLRLKDSFGISPMQKPVREQGRNTQLEGYALAHAQASASETQAALPGTQAPSPASVRLDADERGKHSSSGILGCVAPEEPVFAFPAFQCRSRRVSNGLTRIPRRRP